jgi:transcriptional regulator with GAF, ATPase, and Fis domain
MSSAARATTPSSQMRLVATVPVIVVSANPLLRQELVRRLGSAHWAVSEAESGADALAKLDSAGGDLLLLDPTLRDLDPAEFHALVAAQFPHVHVVTVNPQTGQPLLRSSSPSALALQAVEELERTGALQSFQIQAGRSEAIESGTGLPGMIGDSEAMKRVYSITRLVAKRNTTVVVLGESGTGKDLLAQAIHLLSPRRSNPFVVINCAAIPEALLEAELFGYVKGAFTGAVQSRMGRIHAAQGGTLFLDEIGEMPLALQSKLLRFLEQGEVQRLGSNDNFRVDVRVVAATNVELRKRVEEGGFREDLYYRLAVFSIKLPLLGDRLSDLPSLACSFAQKFCPGVVLTAEALGILRQHTWPGNVRELRNVMERASILLEDSREIKAEHIII